LPVDEGHSFWVASSNTSLLLDRLTSNTSLLLDRLTSNTSVLLDHSTSNTSSNQRVSPEHFVLRV